MATTIPLSRELSNNKGAVRKRQYRVVQKERKRRTYFVHDYVRTKYPKIFNEANQIYQSFVDKYPEKADFTKTYWFKKWQKRIDQSNQMLYVPHLPILSPFTDLCFNQTEEPDQQEEPVQQEEPDQQEEPVQQEEPDQQEEPVQQEEPDQQEEPVQQKEPDQQQSQHAEEPQTGVQHDLYFTGMSINDMSVAVEEIVKTLQSDRELMDIVESFDLPAGVWDNELSVPDYVLESDLDW